MMKKKLTLLLCIMCGFAMVNAQAPQGLSYQAIIRDVDGKLVSDSKVNMRISILQKTVVGKEVYSETHTVVSNVNGLVTLVIGKGQSDDKFESIDWSAGPYFIKSEADPNAGTRYNIVGTTQLLSVPYALYAETAGNSLQWQHDDNGNTSTQGNLGIGTPPTDSSALTVDGSSVFNGNLNVKGKITVDSLDVKSIIGLLGSDVRMNIPDIFNNKVFLEIEGIRVNEDVLMISGLGIEAERISTPIGVDDQGNVRYQEDVGFNQEFPITFEVSDENNGELIYWFNQSDPEIRSMSLVIKDLAKTEIFRFNMYEYVPDHFEPVAEGRNRFTLKSNRPPDNLVQFELDGTLGTEFSFDKQTDKFVEVQGIVIGHNNATPEVKVDTLKRTVSLTFNYMEGGDAFEWIKNTLQGTGERRSMSIVVTTDGTTSTEISRKNYFECVPFKFEVLSGFALHQKLKIRIVIAYGWSEDA